MKRIAATPIITGVLASLLASIILCGIMTSMVWAQKIQLKSVGWAVLLINGISVLTGCAVVVHNRNIKPQIQCIAVTVIYIVVLALINWLCVQQLRTGWGYVLLTAFAAAGLRILTYLKGSRRSRYKKRNRR